MDFTIIFYQMQQTTISTHFPNKLQKMTRKVAKILSEKYNVEDNTVSNAMTSLGKDKTHLINELRLDEEDINNAFEKTQKMHTKLKLIRTMLGYEYESSQKKQKMRQFEHDQQRSPQEKGINLKQFVMSMRKRNEITDKYFKPKRINSIDQNLVSFDPQSKNIQQYTDASLKYVHSFLPHHTMLEHLDQKVKKSSQFLTLTPKYEKSASPTSRNSKYIQTIQNTHSQSGRLESITSLQKNKPNVFKNKRSLTINNPNRSVISTKRSVTYVSDLKKEDASKYMPIQKKQLINLPIVHMDTPTNKKQFKLISNTAPLDVYAARVTQLIYRGKNYNKELKSHFRVHKDFQRMTSQQQKKPFKQLLPVIKQYIPESRNRQGSTAH